MVLMPINLFIVFFEGWVSTRWRFDQPRNCDWEPSQELGLVFSSKNRWVFTPKIRWFCSQSHEIMPGTTKKLPLKTSQRLEICMKNCGFHQHFQGKPRFFFGVFSARTMVLTKEPAAPARIWGQWCANIFLESCVDADRAELSATCLHMRRNTFWLVVWNIWIVFPFSWECDHPNWLSLHHFYQRVGTLW